jgi:hypothetical protein
MSEKKLTTSTLLQSKSLPKFIFVAVVVIVAISRPRWIHINLPYKQHPAPVNGNKTNGFNLKMPFLLLSYANESSHQHITLRGKAGKSQTILQKTYTGATLN